MLVQPLHREVLRRSPQDIEGLAMAMSLLKVGVGILPLALLKVSQL
jgi:hypothetical protein